MLSRRVVCLARIPRALRVTGARFYNSEQEGDVGHQAHVSGFAAKDPKKATPYDAASPAKGKKASRDGLTGNKEDIGFAEQVGSQSASASKSKSETAEGITGEDEITPPAFADAVKKKLGMKTTAGEAKQNRGGGKGVTGTGSLAFDRGKRTMYTCASWMDEAAARRQAPEGSRKPQDSTLGEQNAHLKHKSSPSKPDSGKGNAAEEPTLPSQHVDASRKSSRENPSIQRREFSTTALALQEEGKAEHTAETYFKDVDSTKPTNPKVHQVDPSTGGATVARANEQPATGDFSRAGPHTQEYETEQVSKHDQPYDTPPTRGPEVQKKLRYGGMPGLGPTSGPEEGPEGESKGGRQPEGCAADCMAPSHSIEHMVAPIQITSASLVASFMGGATPTARAIRVLCSRQIMMDANPVMSITEGWLPSVNLRKQQLQTRLTRTLVAPGALTNDTNDSMPHPAPVYRPFATGK
ncbi:hypothetical protein NM688_g3372 [Phlebia brevispora]|uniref:Uncharacterized protein n=1 Tax=Phlebia brevispora TaxID=194682 RepID=A0ACC1T5S1_9APHY|nr:hypothetical protein NM688_g3372 [Phlebia brevispora]